MSERQEDKWGSAAGFIRSIREDIAAGVQDFTRAEMEFALNEMEDGLPVPALRILPPRPPNVAALLDEEARLPAAEVQAVVEAEHAIGNAAAKWLTGKTDGDCLVLVTFGSKADAQAFMVAMAHAMEVKALAALDRKEP